MPHDPLTHHSLPSVHLVSLRALAALLGAVVWSLVAGASAQPAPRPPGSATDPQRGQGDRDALPALPRIVESACRARSGWHGETLRCGNQSFSANMVRVVVGGARYAFVLVGDARATVVDGPTTYSVRLWKDGQRVVPRSAGLNGGGPRGERREDFLARLHVYLPMLPALDDDAAERWLRGLVLASEQTQARGRMTRRGTRRVLRERVEQWNPQDGAASHPDSIRIVEAWLDDAGAWGVRTTERSPTPSEHSAPTVTPEVVETRVRGRVTLGDGGGPTNDDEDFDSASVGPLIRSRMPGIQACYENQLRRDPRLAGRVRVEFTIATSGAVSDLHVAENTTNSSEVAACVTGVVRRFRWNPGPVGGPVTFSYPFELSPQP